MACGHPPPMRGSVVTPIIHLHVLASGSKGNAVIVDGPDGSVLIDCGISRRQVLVRAKELAVDVGRIRCVLLTHEHGDHITGLPVFAKHAGVPMFATAGTVAASTKLSVLPFTLVGHSDAFELPGTGLVAQAFPTSHDVADPMGFRLSALDADGCEADALGYCTDTGLLTDEAPTALRGCRILALEANHDPRMLATGDYPGFLKARIGGETGHLSNAQAAEALPQLVTEDTETVIAMHLSAENNRPSVCRRTLEAALEGFGAGPGTRVAIAAQDAPLTVW